MWCGGQEWTPENRNRVRRDVNNLLNGKGVIEGDNPHTLVGTKISLDYELGAVLEKIKGDTTTGTTDGLLQDALQKLIEFKESLLEAECDSEWQCECGAECKSECECVYDAYEDEMSSRGC